MWSLLRQFIDFAVGFRTVNRSQTAIRWMMMLKTGGSRWMSLAVKVGLAVVTAVLVYAVLAVLQPCSVLVEVFVGEVGKVLVAIGSSFAVTVYLNYYCHSRLLAGRVSAMGKAVFVTGCDSGFGFETALRLYCSGYYVFAGCLEPGINGASTLTKVDGGRRLIPIPLDVTSQEQIDIAYKIVEDICQEKQLQLWALINNAGVAAFSELEICSIDVYKRVLDVNTLGTVRMTKRFLPLLRKSQGRVVIISSLAGCLAYPGLTAYCMSKHAVTAFAQCLRAEVKRWNISVAVIACTGYRTHMLNPVKLIHEIEREWHSAPEEIRQAYGEEYFRNFCTCYVKRLTSVNTNIGEAVDTIVTACEAVSPHDEYFTCFKGELRCFARHLPPQWQDVYMAVFESFEPILSWFQPRSPVAPSQLSTLLLNLHETNSSGNICDSFVATS